MSLVLEQEQPQFALNLGDLGLNICYWPRDQNPRRHNRRPCVEMVKKRIYQKKSQFGVIQPAKDLRDCPQAGRRSFLARRYLPGGGGTPIYKGRGCWSGNFK